MSDNETPQNPYAPNTDGTPPQKPQDAPQQPQMNTNEQFPQGGSQASQTGAQGAYSIPPQNQPPQNFNGQPQNQWNQNPQGHGYQGQGYTVAPKPIDMTVSYAWLFFLGAVGGHKFYMGNTKAGFIYLATTIISSLLSIIGIGFFLYVGILFMVYADIRTMPEQVDEANAGRQNPSLFVWIQKAFNGGASRNRNL